MLSTPPAFNLSQNQTLQFKSVAKISVGRKSESQSSFPFAIHLSMNHTDSLGAKQLFTPLRFRCQQVFFIFAKVFFRGPVGATRWREGDLCLIFKPASRTFLPSGKISFPVALSDVASSLARTALCAFSTPPSSIFPQKNLWICSLLTDYSINIPKRHKKMFEFFFAIFHFLLLFLPGKSHTFPARESILFSPGSDAPLSPYFEFSLSRHQRTHGKEKNTPDTAPWMRH